MAAKYSYGKKTTIRAPKNTASLKVLYSPPGTGYHHDVGDIRGQTNVAKKRAIPPQVLGQDGGVAVPPGNPMRAPVYPWTKKEEWKRKQSLAHGNVGKQRVRRFAPGPPNGYRTD